jgi:Domain of unknown function (DUF5658)
VASGERLLDGPKAEAAPALTGRRAWGFGSARLDVVRTRAGSLFLLLVALNVIDLVTTHQVLANGGQEGNPLMSPLVDNMAGAACVKGICLALVGALIARSGRSVRMMRVLGGVDAWYLLVVMWNIKVLAAIT